jgi:potassium channel subfamily K, other eukaryote
MIGAVVFWKAEKNQSWTYFESIYFAYTTLLTIGYGDFQPISNSGKPFFVFWSLLAVPTLTILISNMGGTVIQLIKDITIWLGEVTVLPSESGSIQQSLKFGISKLIGGRINVQEIKDSDDNIEDTPPGLVRMPPRKDQETHHNKKDVENAQELASEFEQAERLDEEEARKMGDKIAEDIHHYRHILIKEVRNVYADVSAIETRKYTYDEWSYFLKLLGEDEGDSKYHRRALIKPLESDLKKSTDEATAVTKKEQGVEKDGEAGQTHAAPEGPETDRTEDKITQWSWIGSRSPLMGNEDESEWILQKLFARLEEELARERQRAQRLRANKEEETGVKQEAPGWPLQPVREDQEKHLPVHDEDDDKSGESSRTLEGQSSGEEKDLRLTSSENEEGSRRLSAAQGKHS